MQGKTGRIDPPIVVPVRGGAKVAFDGEMIRVHNPRSLISEARRLQAPIDKVTSTKLVEKAPLIGGGIFEIRFEKGFDDFRLLDAQGRTGFAFRSADLGKAKNLIAAVEARRIGDEGWEFAEDDRASTFTDPAAGSPQNERPWWKSPWVVAPAAILGALVLFQTAWAVIDREGYDRWIAEAAAERAAEKQAEADRGRAELASYLNQADAAMEPCERGYAGLVDQMSSFSGSMDARTDLYQLADQVRFVCLERSSDLRAIAIPRGLNDDQEHRAKAMRDACEGALDNIAVFAKAIREVAEYGLSPSRNSDVDRSLGRVKGAVLSCTASRSAMNTAALQ